MQYENEGKLKLDFPQGATPPVEGYKPEEYDVYIGVALDKHVQVTEMNMKDVLGDGTVKFDPATSTLTLTGAKLAAGEETYGLSGIKSNFEKLTIVLNGNNVIGRMEDLGIREPCYEDYAAAYGIQATGDVKITGNASLTIVDYYAGIEAENIDFTDFTGTLTVLDCGEEPRYACALRATGDVTITGGTFNLESTKSNGIYAKNISIGGDKTVVKVRGKDAGGAYSINADTLTISSPLEVTNANETYTAGTKTLTGKNGGYVVIKAPDPAPLAPSGGSSSSTYTVPVSGDKTSVKVQATISGSNATIKNVTSAEIETVGTGDNVVVDLSGVNKSVTAVTIPKTTFDNVAASEASGLEVKFPDGTVAVFDSTTVAAVSEQAAGSSIQLVVDQKSKAEQALTSAQKATVKELNNALVIEAYFVSSGKRISDFKGGSADLTVSYPTTKPVRVWYVAADGTMELVPNTFDGKAAKFVVKHFSHYVIEVLDGSSFASCPKDETCVYAKFTDADTKAWYHDGVHYCVENGMMKGVAEKQFAPNGTLTRGMVVTVLARLNGVEAGTGDEWYAPGQEWAMANGVSDGTNMTANITREQLATMLYRYAVLKGVDTEKFTENTNTLSHNDVFTISDWATSGMHFCIAAGIVGGDDKGNLNPQNNATRAEAAAMFQRFCENITK